MTRVLYAMPAAFCHAAAVVTAQAPAREKPAGTPPATQQPTGGQQPAKPSQSSTMAGDKVTYTGCVKPGTAADTWTLENAQVAAKAGAASPSTVGTSGTGTTLNLDPAASVNLKAHANHKVEVVGTLKPATGAAGSSAGASSTAGGASSTAGAGGSSASRQQFSVESVKMVSATCP
jgi:hypothetical protein